MRRVTPPAEQVAATVDADGQPVTATFARSLRYNPAPAIVRAPAPRRLGFLATIALEWHRIRGDRGFY